MGDVSGQTGCLPGTHGVARWRFRYAVAVARAPCDKGFGGWRRSRSPLKCTAFRLGGGAGCPQSRSRAHHSIAQGFEWRGGRDIHTSSACGTLECRRSPLKFTARRVGFGDGYPHWKWRMASIRRSPSPIEYTGARLGLSAGISPGQAGRNLHAAQSRARAHRCDAQGFEWLPWRLSTSDPAEPPSHAGTLTVENHSASSDPVRGISTWGESAERQRMRAPEGAAGRHSVPEGAHRPVER